MKSDDPLSDLPNGVFDHEINDYYDLLGVRETSAHSEVQEAYRRKISNFHPDQSDHEHAEEITYAINQAKSVLLNQNNRVQYNQLGHEDYYRQEMTNTGNQQIEQQEKNYETNFVDLIKLAKLDDYTKEPWWKTLIKSKGFKIVVIVIAFLVVVGVAASLL